MTKNNLQGDLVENMMKKRNKPSIGITAQIVTLLETEDCARYEVLVFIFLSRGDTASVAEGQPALVHRAADIEGLASDQPAKAGRMS